MNERCTICQHGPDCHSLNGCALCHEERSPLWHHVWRRDDGGGWELCAGERKVPADGNPQLRGESWEDYAAERDELGERLQQSGGETVIMTGDYWYDWSNPEDRPVMRAALGRFAPDGPVFGENEEQR